MQEWICAGDEGVSQIMHDIGFQCIRLSPAVQLVALYTAPLLLERIRSPQKAPALKVNRLTRLVTRTELPHELHSMSLSSFSRLQVTVDTFVAE